MATGDCWLDAIWLLVQARLPAPPARVIDIGCGRLGGFVPFLRSGGYEAVGVDPEAPDATHYHRVKFEDLDLPVSFDAAIASTSLHHVTDPARVIEQLTGTLTSGGAFVVVEWDWEKFDDGTAQWCFQRLGEEDHANWLHRRRNDWAASGQAWEPYLRDWATREGVHRGEALLQLLDEHFERRLLAHGPFFFPDLAANITESDEQAAIDAGAIQANRIDWVGALP
jgi:SAM-dependent methyltransferase